VCGVSDLNKGHFFRFWVIEGGIKLCSRSIASKPNVASPRRRCTNQRTDSTISIWLGNAENNERWREIKAQVKAERGAKCERCGSPVNLDLHHRKAKRYGGKDTSDNAELLCESCHMQTPTYGDHGRLQ
jgi:5-methylcytosine-specific restriction endonuclease McrA